MIKPILAVVCLGVAGAILFMYTQPTYDGIQSMKLQIQEYDQALEKAAELQALKQSLLTRSNSFNPADLERLKKLLPDHVDNVRLVLDLDSLAGRHGMALQNVTISEPQSKSSDEDAISVGPSGEMYDSLTLQFGTQGTYTTFSAFLQDLENSLRIVDLMNLDLSLMSSEAGAEPIYTYKISLRTYWLK